MILVSVCSFTSVSGFLMYLSVSGFLMYFLFYNYFSFFLMVCIFWGFVCFFCFCCFYYISFSSSNDGNSHGSSMSHAMTAPPKPSFKAPWRLGNAIVGRRNAGWTTAKSGRPYPCQTCLQGPPAEKIGRASLPNRFSCPVDDPIGQGTELN